MVTDTRGRLEDKVWQALKMGGENFELQRTKRKEVVTNGDLLAVEGSFEKNQG